MTYGKALIFLVSALLAAACVHQAEPPEPDRAAVAGEAAARDAERRLQRAAIGAAASAKVESRPGIAPPAAPAPAGVLGAGRYEPMIQDRENYAHVAEGGVQRVAEHPVSTFSIDVDTGAYSNVRRFLNDGALPRQDAVRVEELVNYFDYAYPAPADPATPFSVHTELAPTPWNPKTHLLRIALQGWRPHGAPPPSNLVFLVDVSGSMASADKLPLVKDSLRLLVDQLDARDRIALVVYAGASGVVLEPTPGDRKAEIRAALDRLEAGGSTNGAAGIELAYAMAQRGYLRGGINRVLLATDGDFNVGVVSFAQLEDLVEEKRRSGVALSTLGFGTGNYNDHLLEQLADAGNGNYTYVDSLSEARRALVQMRAATLQTIAKDVKVQVEFNAAAVAEYRLIGYENRALAREDFANDQVDAGEIGAGHSVTALYEIALRGSGGERIAPLRYGVPGAADAHAAPANPAEIAFLRLRYKRPDGDASRLLEQAITGTHRVDRIAHASPSLRFAAAVAAFGQLLRGGRYTGSYGYGDVLRLAQGAHRDDAWQREFLELVARASDLSTRAGGPTTEIGD